ncbi:MAG: B12-binding domain-containing radical SAM protein, partial [Candidatus Odinarchaeota archaeon]
IKNPVKKDYYIKDLDDLPFPFSEDQINIFKIYNPNLKYVHQEEDKISLDVKRNKGTIGIVSSRGCPYNCQFCSSTLFWGLKWRFRSPKNVVDEIDFYYKKFGFRYFTFRDDSFNVIPKRGIEICKEIIKRNLKIRFNITTRVDSVTDESVVWLKRAGCDFAAFGIESGSKKIRKTINKNLSLQSIIKGINIYKKNKVPTRLLLMVGNPGESNETIKKTITLLKIIKPKDFSVSLTMVFPGTQLYELAKAQQFIDDNYWLTKKPPPYYTYENSLRTLKKWAYEINNYNKRFLKIRSTLYSIIFYVYFTEKFPWRLKKFLFNLHKIRKK